MLKCSVFKNYVSQKKDLQVLLKGCFNIRDIWATSLENVSSGIFDQ